MDAWKDFSIHGSYEELIWRLERLLLDGLRSRQNSYFFRDHSDLCSHGILFNLSLEVCYINKWQNDEELSLLHRVFSNVNLLADMKYSHLDQVWRKAGLSSLGVLCCSTECPICGNNDGLLSPGTLLSAIQLADLHAAAARGSSACELHTGSALSHLTPLFWIVVDKRQNITVYSGSRVSDRAPIRENLELIRITNMERLRESTISSCVMDYLDGTLPNSSGTYVPNQFVFRNKEINSISLDPSHTQIAHPHGVENALLGKIIMPVTFFPKSEPAVYSGKEPQAEYLDSPDSHTLIDPKCVYCSKLMNSSIEIDSLWLYDSQRNHFTVNRTEKGQIKFKANFSSDYDSSDPFSNFGGFVRRDEILNAALITMKLTLPFVYERYNNAGFLKWKKNEKNVTYLHDILKPEGSDDTPVDQSSTTSIGTDNVLLSLLELIHDFIGRFSMDDLFSMDSSKCASAYFLYSVFPLLALYGSCIGPQIDEYKAMVSTRLSKINEVINESNERYRSRSRSETNESFGDVNDVHHEQLILLKANAQRVGIPLMSSTTFELIEKSSVLREVSFIFKVDEFAHCQDAVQSACHELILGNKQSLLMCADLYLDVDYLTDPLSYISSMDIDDLINHVYYLSIDSSLTQAHTHQDSIASQSFPNTEFRKSFSYCSQSNKAIVDKLHNSLHAASPNSLDFSTLLQNLSKQLTMLIYKIISTPLDFLPCHMSLIDWVTSTKSVFAYMDDRKGFDLLRKFYPCSFDPTLPHDIPIRIKILCSLLLNVHSLMWRVFIGRLERHTSVLFQQNMFEELPANALHSKLSDFLRKNESNESITTSSIAKPRVLSIITEKMDLFNVLTTQYFEVMQSSPRTPPATSLWGCSCDGIPNPVFSCSVWHKCRTRMDHRHYSQQSLENALDINDKASIGGLDNSMSAGHFHNPIESSRTRSSVSEALLELESEYLSLGSSSSINIQYTPGSGNIAYNLTLDTLSTKICIPSVSLETITFSPTRTFLLTPLLQDAYSNNNVLASSTGLVHCFSPDLFCDLSSASSRALNRRRWDEYKSTDNDEVGKRRHYLTKCRRGDLYSLPLHVISADISLFRYVNPLGGFLDFVIWYFEPEMHKSSTTDEGNILANLFSNMIGTFRLGKESGTSTFTSFLEKEVPVFSIQVNGNTLNIGFSVARHDPEEQRRYVHAISHFLVDSLRSFVHPLLCDVWKSSPPKSMDKLSNRYSIERQLMQHLDSIIHMAKEDVVATLLNHNVHKYYLALEGRPTCMHLSQTTLDGSDSIPNILDELSSIFSHVLKVLAYHYPESLHVTDENPIHYSTSIERQSAIGIGENLTESEHYCSTPKGSLSSSSDSFPPSSFTGSGIQTIISDASQLIMDIFRLNDLRIIYYIVYERLSKLSLPREKMKELTSALAFSMRTRRSLTTFRNGESHTSLINAEALLRAAEGEPLFPYFVYDASLSRNQLIFASDSVILDFDKKEVLQLLRTSFFFRAGSNSYYFDDSDSVILRRFAYERACKGSLIDQWSTDCTLPHQPSVHISCDESSLTVSQLSTRE